MLASWTIWPSKKVRDKSERGRKLLPDRMRVGKPTPAFAGGWLILDETISFMKGMDPDNCLLSVNGRDSSRGKVNCHI
jgi:hypothetical protein